MTVEATGYSNTGAVGNIGYNSYDNTQQQDNREARLKNSNVWDFSNYFNGGYAQTAFNA